MKFIQLEEKPASTLMRMPVETKDEPIEIRGLMSPRGESYSFTMPPHAKTEIRAVRTRLGSTAWYLGKVTVEPKIEEEVAYEPPAVIAEREMTEEERAEITRAEAAAEIEAEERAQELKDEENAEISREIDGEENAPSDEE